MLVANGHPDAFSYPLGVVADEMILAIERINALLASEGVVMHAAAAAIMSPKEGGSLFKGVIERLTEHGG